VTKVEEVARAISERLVGSSGPECLPNTWPNYVDAARDVLLAMREPTEAMVTAMRATIVEAVDSGRMTKAAAINDWKTKNTMRWSAGIDAALSEGEG
jgi:hypothetical protein